MTYYTIQHIAYALGFKVRHLLQELKALNVITGNSTRSIQQLTYMYEPSTYIKHNGGITYWNLAGVRLIARALSSQGYGVPVNDADILNLLRITGG